jgi:hypothetical protein
MGIGIPRLFFEGPHDRDPPECFDYLVGFVRRGRGQGITVAFLTAAREGVVEEYSFVFPSLFSFRACRGRWFLFALQYT